MLSYDDWMNSLDEKAAKLPRVQATISNFQVLPRLGKLLSIKAQDCSECKYYWMKLQEATVHLDQFFDDGNRYSADFDHLVEEIFGHLKAQHNFRPKGMVLSLYTFAGMILGISVALLFVYLTHIGSIKAGVVLGWLIGTMAGWTGGKIKEGKMSKQNQLF
jgi:hypothetical protein